MQHLGLNVMIYDPQVHFQQVRCQRTPTTGIPLDDCCARAASGYAAAAPPMSLMNSRRLMVLPSTPDIAPYRFLSDQGSRSPNSHLPVCQL
jgi:hypothetical protein